MNIKISIIVDGVVHKWDELSKKQQEEYGRRLNVTAMNAIGYIEKNGR